VIYTFGNETQKKQYLPRIASVDDWWCQGFSEPGSGSDLASLKTKAERKGDKYIINGQRPGHAGAARRHDLLPLPYRYQCQEADGHLLHRVRHEVERRHGAPIQTSTAATGQRSFFDDVRCRENLIGEENKGWIMPNSCSAMSAPASPASAFPRSGCAASRTSRPRSNPRQAGARGSGFSRKARRVEIELKALELTQLRVVADENKHGKAAQPGVLGLEDQGSEIQQTTPNC